MNASPANLRVWVGDTFVCVKITGRAACTCSVDFRNLILGLREKGFRRFILYLTDCQLMDSTFLGVLAGFGLKAAESAEDKPTVTLLNLNQRILDLLENLGVAHLFQLMQGTEPLSQKCRDARPTDGARSKLETARACLEAHETLMSINPANIPKFKDVTRFMAEDLKRLEAQKS